MNFSGLRLPRNEARKVLEKFGENSEQNSGPKFGKLLFCNFSGLMKSVSVRVREEKGGTIPDYTLEIHPETIAVCISVSGNFQPRTSKIIERCV